MDSSHGSFGFDLVALVPYLELVAGFAVDIHFFWTFRQCCDRSINFSATVVVEPLGSNVPELQKIMRRVGFEPTRIAPRDLKSLSLTNSDIYALEFGKHVSKYIKAHFNSCSNNRRK